MGMFMLWLMFNAHTSIKCTTIKWKSNTFAKSPFSYSDLLSEYPIYNKTFFDVTLDW